MKQVYSRMLKLTKCTIPNCVPCHPKVDVWVSNSDKDLQDWLQKCNISKSQHISMGFDVEWRPNFVAGVADCNKIAIVQVFVAPVLNVLFYLDFGLVSRA